MRKFTTFRNRVHIVVPANRLNAANSFAKSLDENPDRTKVTSYLTVPLWPVGTTDFTAPPTHWGCSGQVDDQDRTQINAQLGNFPGASVHGFRTSEAPQYDIDGNVTDPGYTDPTEKSFESFIADAGLMIQPAQ